MVPFVPHSPPDHSRLASGFAVRGGLRVDLRDPPSSMAQLFPRMRSEMGGRLLASEDTGSGGSVGQEKKPRRMEQKGGFEIGSKEVVR